jgi:hypothetical protein
VRNGELSDIRIGHLRLHDPEGARFHVPDSKTAVFALGSGAHKPRKSTAAVIRAQLPAWDVSPPVDRQTHALSVGLRAGFVFGCVRGQHESREPTSYVVGGGVPLSRDLGLWLEAAET